MEGETDETPSEWIVMRESVIQVSLHSRDVLGVCALQADREREREREMGVCRWRDYREAARLSVPLMSVSVRGRDRSGGVVERTWWS